MRCRIPLIACLFVCTLGAADWKPVSSEQLKLSKPKIDPNADAEAIFWDAWITDVNAGNGYLNHVVDNYIRIKIYNERGVENFGNVEIPYFSERNMSLTDLKARTIKPDGTIVDVPGSAFVERTASKTGRRKVKVKSFALPGLQPGAIIEYQFTEVYSEFVPRYVELEMQREIPAWEINKNVRPYSGFTFNEQMRAYPFNCQPSAWEPVRGDVRRQGFVNTHVTDVPAFVEEPSMPAEDDVKAWMLIYYTPTSKDKPDVYWPSVGRNLLSEFRKQIKSGGEVKQVALEITSKASDPFEKANLLAAYCLSQIRNISFNAEGVTSEMRRDFFKNLKEYHNTSDTLKLKMGTSRHILSLFFAMAEASGLNPVYVRGGSANTAVFRADFLDPFLLRNIVIGIPSGDQVRYYNPGIPYLPVGMIDWDEQGQPALFADAKNPKLVLLPPSAPEASTLKRTANLKLNEDGSIQGLVSMTFGGHFGASEKMIMESQSEGTRVEEFKKRLEARYPGARISDLKIENANSTSGLLKVTYSIAMEGFGQRTGKRLFFQPAFFNYGDKPLFPNKERKYPVSFRHPYAEEDSIRIEYPANFKLDSAEMPGKLKIGEIGSYSLSAASSNSAPVLSIERKFIWGNGNVSYFEPKYYKSMKDTWDAIHANNSHMLTLKVN